MKRSDVNRLAELHDLVKKARSPEVREEVARLLPQLFVLGVPAHDAEAFEQRVPRAAWLFLVETYIETDRGCVLVAASYIDKMLEDLLRAAMVETKDGGTVKGLLKSTGTLGNLMTRVRLSYALGLISRAERDDLEVITDIRNARAHQVAEGALDGQEVAKLLSKLKLIPPIKSPDIATMDPRGKFLLCATTLISVLERRALSVQRPKVPVDLDLTNDAAFLDDWGDASKRAASALPHDE